MTRCLIQGRAFVLIDNVTPGAAVCTRHSCAHLALEVYGIARSAHKRKVLMPLVAARCMGSETSTFMMLQQFMMFMTSLVY